MAFNEKNRDRVMPHFAQEHMARAAAKGGLDSKEYLDALDNAGRDFVCWHGVERAEADCDGVCV